MKKIFLLLLGALLFASGSFAQVTVTATAGTTGPTSYTTLKGAFDAINAGTHQGAVIIEISASTTEGTTPATLNSSGAGSSVYTSVLIRPTADGVSVSGSPVTGFGVIQLKGADNVTIDGDNPNTPGTNRNLTIANTTTATVIANSVIRIANAATVVTSSDNITIKNCILNDNVTSGNASGITSTTGSSNSSFGIYVGGNGGTTATDAPTAITSVTSQIIPAATTVNSLVIDNNAINQTARGIEFNGAATSNSTGVTITKNDIGNPTAGGATGVYSMGITVQGSSLVNISGNTIYVESYVATSIRGIDIGSISTNATGVTIEKNKVARVWDNTTGGFGSYGINYQGGNGAVIQNNFVYNINAFLDNASISTTFGPHGIRITSGTTHKIYHNSVNLFGALFGSASISMASAFTITSTSVTGMDLRNNIFANTLTGAVAGTPVDCIALPSGLTTTFNLTDNNNACYSNSQLGQSGTSSVSGFTIAGFNSGSTAGATNWRSYTSTLLTANTNNDNASFAFSTAPPFTAATNLHIPAATITQLESGGASVGLTTDIDGDTRPGPAGSVNGGATAPDIGADEFDGAPLTICTGTPNPGNTTSTANPVCSGVSFTLGIQNAQTSTGITYQWQSSSNGVSYSPVVGATSSSYTASQTSSTYYNVVLTCSGSGLSATSAPLQVTMNTPANCYCTPTYSSGGSTDNITNVVLGTLSNNTLAAGNPSPYFVNYTTQQPSPIAIPNLTTGSSATVNVTMGSDATQYSAVWIDFNQNGIFEATEYFTSGTNAGASGTANISIAIPASATLGNTRMRIRGGDDSQPTSGQACGASSSSFGEAEDYLVNIIAGVPCSGSPNAGTSAVTPNILCGSGTVVLSNSGAGPGVDLTYQWSSASDNAHFGDIAGATSTSYSTTASATTYYRLAVTCPGSSTTVFSNSALVTVTGVPANDLVCNATTLILGGAADCGNTTCATATGDPTFSNSTPNNTVWYIYTPVTTGAIQITMSRPAGVTTGLLNGWLGIYTATGTCPLLALTETPSALTYDLTANASVVLSTPTLTAGTTYYFMIDGFSGAFGAYCIKADPPPAAPNCTTNISPVNLATGVALPPTLQWNAATGATSYDIFFGTDGITYTNIGNIAGTSAIINGTTPSTSYFWYVTPKNAGGSATGCQASATSFTTGAPPGNDLCSNATNLVVSNGFCMNPVGGSLAGADITAGLATPSCAFGGTSQNFDVWYKVTVPATGNITIRTSALKTSSGNDQQIVAYSGTCGALTAIGCDEDGNPEPGINDLHSWLGLTGQTPGSIIYIRVTAYDAASLDSFAICAFDTSATILPNVSAGTPGSCLAGSPVIINQAHANIYMWVPIVDGSGNIIGEIYPNGNSLGNTTDGLFKNNSGTPRLFNGQYYLDRNITITPANQPAAANKVKVKLYFTNAELLALQTISPGTTRANLALTKENTNCPSVYTATGGVLEGNAANGAYKTDHYIETDTVSSFSTFFIERNFGGPLPVTITNFNAKRNGTVNDISWSTSQEINTSLFVIERSTDGRNFTQIGIVAAAGNSSTLRTYQFTDISPVKAVNYYRLRIVDRDNNIKFSDVRSVRNTGNADFTIYPNPVKDVMKVDINADKADKGVMIITDINGRQVYSHQVNITAGSNTLSVDISNMAQGAYIIKIQLSDDMVVKKFTKM